MSKELVMKPSEFDVDKALDFLEEAFNSGVTDRWWTFHAYLRGRRLADHKHGEMKDTVLCDVDDDEFIYTFDDHKDKIRRVMQHFVNMYEHQKDKLDRISLGFIFIPLSYWQSEHRVDIVLVNDKHTAE